MSTRSDYEKVKNLELEAILTITTGYSCVDDFDKVWKLVWFVCDNNMIGPMWLGMVKDQVKNHLLTIYPELKEAKYQEGKDIDEFISQQVEKFDRVLPVTKLGIKLPEKYKMRTSSYNSSSDSKVVDGSLGGFEYDLDKTDQALSKNENFDKNDELVKCLKLSK